MKKQSTLGWFAKTGAVVTLACATALPIGNLHPYFTLKHILPPEMNEIAGIGGIDLLPNGDGAICTWGGSQKSLGEVWIVPGLDSGTPGTPVRIATGLREPLGLKAVGNDFYVMEKSGIVKFTGAGTEWTKTAFWALPVAWYNDAQWHHFSFNLLLRDQALWFSTGTAFDYDPKDPIQRGALLKVPLSGGEFSQLARGLRNPDGLSLGVDGEFFANENQGHWKPANALYHLPITGIPANGRFYGFRTNDNNACGITPPAVTPGSCPEDPEYPPAIWIPYGSVSNSPTRPILLDKGPYAGQMISGDVFFGGTLRYFLEKINGEYQGAVFSMMTPGASGVGFGIHQFLATQTGSLLAAGIGGGACGLGGSDNWAWNKVCRGLDLLTPTGAAPFEPLSIRAVPGGFDVEFTKPAGPTAGDKANWQVKTTVFSPTVSYGLDRLTSDNNVIVAVTSAELSPDGRRVRLQLASTATRRMYAITMKNTVVSAEGDSAYTNVGYYTLNSEATSSSLNPALASHRNARFKVADGWLALNDVQAACNVGLFTLDGAKVAGLSGASGARLRTVGMRPGLYLVSGRVDGSPVSEKIRID